MDLLEYYNINYVNSPNMLSQCLPLVTKCIKIMIFGNCKYTSDNIFKYLDIL